MTSINSPRMEKKQSNHDGKRPMITEDDFMELYINFEKLLINYKIGLAYKERISYQDKKGWELMLDYISKRSQLYKYINKAIEDAAVMKQ